MWLRTEDGPMVNASGLVIDVVNAGSMQQEEWWLVARSPGAEAAEDAATWERLCLLDSAEQGWRVLDEIQHQLEAGKVVIDVLEIMEAMREAAVAAS